MNPGNVTNCTFRFIWRPFERQGALSCLLLTLIFNIFFTPLVYADSSIRTGPAYFERDLMLLSIAIVSLILFHFLKTKTERVRTRPIGRRITDLTKFGGRMNIEEPPNNEIIPFTNTNWEPSQQEVYSTFPTERLAHWQISLFSVTPITTSLERFGATNSGLFVFANNKDDAERFISPLQRKIVSRYRAQFSNISVMHLTPPTSEISSFTWLPNDLAIWNAIIGFVDECLAISELLDCEPSLSICRGLCFWIEIEWPADLYTEWIQKIGSETPELEFTSEDGNVGLRLHISFPQSLVPQAALAAQKRTAEKQTA